MGVGMIGLVGVGVCWMLVLGEYNARTRGRARRVLEASSVIDLRWECEIGG